MDVIARCPLPVGVLAWESAEPLVTVVVKATFTLGHDGEAALAEEQQPLALDRPSEIDPGELLSASDFAPWKTLADVLLVGHAHLPEPSRVSVVSFQVDDLQRRFVAHAAPPSARIPLAGAYLREGLARSSTVVRVGPQSPRAEGRIALAGEAPAAWIDDHGTLLRPLPRGFDFRFFNAAPPEQQVESLGEDLVVRLTGLLPHARSREVRLPGIQPRVFLLDPSKGERSEGTEIELTCDTLVIDIDRAACSLTWRGMLERRYVPERARLFMTTQRLGENLAWASIARDLDRGVVTQATEPPRAKKERPSDLFPRKKEEVTATVQLDGLVRASLEALPFKKAAGPRPIPPIPRELRSTVPLDKLVQSSIDALPFKKQASLDALPFKKPPPPEAPSPPVARRPVPREEVTATVQLDQLVRASIDALPFKRAVAEAPGPPRAPRSRSKGATLPLDDLGQVSLAAIPFTGAPPPAPLTASAEHRLSPLPVSSDGDLLPLESFAEIKMEIWARPAARLDVLERHGLSEGTWRFQELRHTEALELEARAGGWERAQSLAAALLGRRPPAERPGL